MLFFDNSADIKDQNIKNLIIKNIYNSMEKSYGDIARKIIIYIKYEVIEPKMYYEDADRNELDKIHALDGYEYSDRIIIGMLYELEEAEFFNLFLEFIAFAIYDYGNKYTDIYVGKSKEESVEHIKKNLKSNILDFFFVDFKSHDIKIEKFKENEGERG